MKNLLNKEIRKKNISKAFFKYQACYEDGNSGINDVGNEDYGITGEHDQIHFEDDPLFNNINLGTFAAIYSDESSNELFYIVQVLDKNIAETDLSELIKKGDQYLKCRYLEKVDENMQKRIII